MSSPHSAKITAAAAPQRVVTELVEEVLRVHPVDAEQHRGDQGGEIRHAERIEAGPERSLAAS